MGSRGCMHKILSAIFNPLRRMKFSALLVVSSAICVYISVEGNPSALSYSAKMKIGQQLDAILDNLKSQRNRDGCGTCTGSTCTGGTCNGGTCTGGTCTTGTCTGSSCTGASCTGGSCFENGAC